MSFDKLARQLKREAAANKGKALALAGMCLVAAYFWAPLVAGWFSGKKTSPPQTANTVVAIAKPATTALPNSTVTGTATTEVKEQNSEDWMAVLSWMKHDSLMKTAQPYSDKARDPFRRPEVSQDKSDEELAVEDRAKARTAEEDLKRLEWKLTSTLVTSRRSIIQINGKTYSIATQPDGRPLEKVFVKRRVEDRPYEFQVVLVQPSRVVLHWDKQFVELRIKKPELAGNDEIRFDSSTLGKRSG